MFLEIYGQPRIYLGPSGNRQGSHNYFDLHTSSVVVRRSAKQIPWPDRLIRKADAWGKKGKKLNYAQHIRVSKQKWREI